MTTENKMGVMPVNRLLVSMSVPMMLSMLVQASTTWWTACLRPRSVKMR